MLDGLREKMHKYGFSMRFDDMSEDIDGAVDVVCYLLDISLLENNISSGKMRSMV